RRIARAFPDSAAQSDALAARLARGCFDLLGYRDVRFDGAGQSLDWHYDPVSGRRAPNRFSSAVPFLDADTGDPKGIWELHRHRYWTVLGRAYWLTGSRRHRDLVLAHLESWMAANPPLMGTNWASMLELAFRSLSWTWAVNFFVEKESEDRG